MSDTFKVSDIARLALQVQASPSAATWAAFFVAADPLICRIARRFLRIGRGNPSLIPDAEQDARIAAMRAVVSYDPERGTFEKLLTKSICQDSNYREGAIGAEPNSRAFRRVRKALREGAHTVDEIVQAARVRTTTAQGVLDFLSARPQTTRDDDNSERVVDETTDRCPTPEAQYERAEVIGLVMKEVRSQDLEMVEAYYVDGLSFKQIGTEAGLTAARIQQRVSAAVRKARRAVGEKTPIDTKPKDNRILFHARVHGMLDGLIAGKRAA